MARKTETAGARSARPLPPTAAGGGDRLPAAGRRARRASAAPRTPVAHRRRRAWQAGEQRRGRAVAHEREVAGEHLVEHEPDGKEIGAFVGLVAERLFGREVVDRPEQRAHRGGPGLVGSERQRHPQVAELRLPGRREEDVAGLDVAMDDPGGVERRQAGEQLPADLDCLADRQRSAPQAVAEAAAGEELEDEESEASSPTSNTRSRWGSHVAPAPLRARRRRAFALAPGLRPERHCDERAIPGAEDPRSRSSAAPGLVPVREEAAEGAGVAADPAPASGFQVAVGESGLGMTRCRSSPAGQRALTPVNLLPHPPYCIA